MTKQDADAVVQLLQDRFKGHVEAEEVARGRFRLTLVSPKFANLSHLKRQDQVWEVIDENVDRERGLDISLILTFAPGETQLVPED